MQYEHASVNERRTLPPAVAVSVVAFALRPPSGSVTGESSFSGGATTIWLPLVRRTRAPFLGAWALPGGPTEWDETLDATALRALNDAVQCVPGTLEQLYSFGGVERSAEAQRLVTIAYWALYGEHELDRGEELGRTTRVPAATPAQMSWPGLPDEKSQSELYNPSVPLPEANRPKPQRRWDDPEPRWEETQQASGRWEQSKSDASRGHAAEPGDANVSWFSADQLPELAFDHAEIVAYALSRLRAKTEYAAVAHRFLGPVFTLGRLRSVTEAVLGQTVDPANFRRQALAQGTLIDTGDLETGARHRPARLYRFSDPAAPPTPASQALDVAGSRAARPAAHAPIQASSTSSRSRA